MARTAVRAHAGGEQGDVLERIFPDGVATYCQDKILLVLAQHADRHGIATGQVVPVGCQGSLGVEELAAEAGLPLETARSAVRALETTGALSRFISRGVEVWVLADPDDDGGFSDSGYKRSYTL